VQKTGKSSSKPSKPHHAFRQQQHYPQRGSPLLVFWLHSVFWTKSLVCKDVSQGFYYSEVLQSQKIFSSLSAVQIIEPSRSDAHLSLFHLFGQRAIPSGLQTDQASSVRTTCLSVWTLHYFNSTSRRLSVLEQSQILSKF